MIRINIFDGTNLQIPKQVDVTINNSNTYQDLITTLINAGEKSGQIYTMHGEEVNYDGLITEREIQYITFNGNIEPRKLLIRKKRGGILLIPYNENMIARDVYNYIIALAKQTPGFKISYGYNELNLNDKIKLIDISPTILKSGLVIN